MRVLVAEDSVLFREGLTRLLTEAGHAVVAEIGDARELTEACSQVRPDLCIVDIRMPPHDGADGAIAARDLRDKQPHQPILMLSQHIETRPLTGLLSSGAFGYLLKDRVLRVDDFIDAAVRVADGGSALDPGIVRSLIDPGRNTRLSALTRRELDVLGLAAEGLSNTTIADRLVLSERTVESHMRNVFTKLDIPDSATTNRRVVAVLAYLQTPTA